MDIIYCAIRGNNPLDHLQASFGERKLEYPEIAHEKVRILPYVPGRLIESLQETTREEILDKLTHIIHAAWPVNFHLPLMAFYPHLKDVRDLIQLSLDVASMQPARLLFGSSMGVALNTIGQRNVAELPIMDFRQGISTGYTQSKLVAEYIVQNAVENFDASASILRIGQIIGDTKEGIWNDSEAPPMIIRSALALGCLPTLEMVSLKTSAGNALTDSYCVRNARGCLLTL